MAMASDQDLRDAPRYRVYLPTELAGQELIANNISAIGFQLSCPSFLMGSIASDLEKDVIPVILKPMKFNPIRLGCRVVYINEIEDEYLLGIRIVQLDDSDQVNLNRYMVSLEKT